jgi:hypothetical protein
MVPAASILPMAPNLPLLLPLLPLLPLFHLRGVAIERPDDSIDIALEI